jgi:hypothetical protein
VASNAKERGEVVSAELDLLAKILVSSLDLYLDRDDTDPNMALWIALLEQQARALDCGVRA